ncbi:MAG: methyltransferase [Hyphomonadaceae bacterium]
MQPSSGLWRLSECGEGDIPFWAYAWAGGLALARYALDKPEAFRGKSVLDLGTGSGLVAIAAAKAGAAHVLAADIDANAVEAAAINAALNDVSIEVHHGDLTQGPPPKADLILVGDLFYDRALAKRVLKFLDRCLAAKTRVSIGDPVREFLPRRRMKEIAANPAYDVGGAIGRSKGNSVFELRRWPGLF